MSFAVLLLAASPASASDLTFVCPGVESAADAHAWSEVGRLGVLDRMEGMMAMAQEHFEPGCPSVWSEDGLPEGAIVAESCTTSAGVAVSVAQSVEAGVTSLDVTVSRAAGAWTELNFAARFAGSRDPLAGPVVDTQAFEASWTGTLDPAWPEDGRARGSWSYTAQGEGLDHRVVLAETWADPECRWSAHALTGLVSAWDVSIASPAGNHRISVLASADTDGCADSRFDLTEAEVDAEGWGTCAVADADDDGFGAEFDCDDQNAAVYPGEDGSCAPLGASFTESAADDAGDWDRAAAESVLSELRLSGLGREAEVVEVPLGE